jgi:hypothetical protein
MAGRYVQSNGVWRVRGDGVSERPVVEKRRAEGSEQSDPPIVPVHPAVGVITEASGDLTENASIPWEHGFLPIAFVCILRLNAV